MQENNLTGNGVKIKQRENSMPLKRQKFIFTKKQEFPVEIDYRGKRYILYLTKNDRLMLQKPL